MTQEQALEWRDIAAPVVKLREPDRDGLELHVRQVTVPREGFYGSYALGDVVTVSSGSLERHENVFLSRREPMRLAGWLEAALKSPRRARILSTFDDGMTLRIQGDGQDSWTVECRPVPLPRPSDTWKSFPHFSFRLTAASIQRAISELKALARALPPMEPPRAARSGPTFMGRFGILLGCGIAAIVLGLRIEPSGPATALLFGGAALSAAAFVYAVTRRGRAHAGRVLLGVAGGCSTLFGACTGLLIGIRATTGCPVMGDSAISYAVENRAGRQLTIAASGLSKQVDWGGTLQTSALAPCGNPEFFERAVYVVTARDGERLAYCRAFSYNDIKARDYRLVIDREEDACSPEQRPRP